MFTLVRTAVTVAVTCLVAAGGATAVAVHEKFPVNSAVPCQSIERAVIVNLDNKKHRHILDHAWDEWRHGKPRYLHKVDGAQAEENREESLRGVPTKKGYDRDEYPPAATREGGAGADVRYVESSENRSSGAVTGNQLRRFCVGQVWRYELPPSH